MPENHDRDMEKLSRAIVEAILGSKDVKQALELIQNVDERTAKTLMVFVLKLDSLSEIKSAEISEFRDGEIEETEEFRQEKLKRRKVRRKLESPEVIDGRAVSKSEKKFLDYLSDKFDTEGWLRKYGISLD